MKTWMVISLIAISGLRAETVTLKPVKDSDVYSYPGAGQPTSTIFSLGVSSTPPSYPTLHSQKSLIQFSLSSLPFSAAEIASAELRLYVLPPDPAWGDLYPGDVHVHRQAADWGAVTASSPKWTAFQSAAPMGSFPVTVESANGWVGHDVTETVIGWAAGTFPNHGLFLAPAEDRMSSSLNVTFASMEVPGYEPRLVIARKPPPPPPLAISGGASGIVLEWPVAGSAGWTLETAENLAGPWTPPAASPVQDGGVWRLVRPLNPSGREFFRLSKP